MTKIKIYRVMGWILFVYGIVGWFCYLVKKVSEGEVNLSYPSVMGLLTMYILNPFFWVGLVLLKKAGIGSRTEKKPAWLVWLLTIYVICGLILIMLLLIVSVSTLWLK